MAPPRAMSKEGKLSAPRLMTTRRQGGKLSRRRATGSESGQTLEPEANVAQRGSAQSDEQLLPTEPASVSASLADLIQHAVTREGRKALTTQQDSPHVYGSQRGEGQAPLPCDHPHIPSILIGLPPPGERQPGGFDDTCEQQSEHFNSTAQGRPIIPDSFPLGAKVTDVTKQNIWANEHIDLRQLLKPTTSNNGDQFHLSMTSVSGVPSLCLFQAPKHYLNRPIECCLHGVHANLFLKISIGGESHTEIL